MAWVPCTAGETAKAPNRLSHVGTATRIRVSVRAPLGMRESARLPGQGLGAMGEDLDATLRHLAHFHTRNGEGRRYGLPAGVDRSLHLDQRPHPKPALR